MSITHSKKFTTKGKEADASKIILRGFYRNILGKLWHDVEEGRIPPNVIGGISKDIRKILYT